MGEYNSKECSDCPSLKECLALRDEEAKQAKQAKDVVIE
jgi:hypothetical protein